jgi:hypothetical protein
MLESSQRDFGDDCGFILAKRKLCEDPVSVLTLDSPAGYPGRAATLQTSAESELAGSVSLMPAVGT